MAVNSLNSVLQTTRLTGLSSGMDTDTIVQNMMKLEQNKLNRELRQKTLLEWRQESYNSIATDLKEFRNTYMSVLSEKNVLSEATFNQFDVKAHSENGAVSIVAGIGAKAGTIKVNQVTQLAKGTTASGSKASTGDCLDSTAVKLEDLELKNPLTFVNGEISFKINGETFTFTKEDTLQNVITEINANEKAGVTFGYSQLTDSFTLETKQMGEGQVLLVENVKGNAFGFDDLNKGAFQIIAARYENGQAAKITINGTEVERNSNKFTIDGVSYTLNDTTEADADLRFTLTRNTEGTIDAIKGFIDGYNTLVQKLDGLITEKKDNDYYPLTDDEKASLTEKQVEQWEEKAKAGLLKNDQGVRTLLDNLRSALYEAVEGVGLSPAEIGLKTGSWEKKGQIELDESALRAAFEKSPEQVMAVFMQLPSSEDDEQAYKECGLLYRITGFMDTYTKGTHANTLDTIDENLAKITKKIDDMSERMYDLQEKYYLKYAAMETALSELNNQSTWLTSMLSGLNK